MDLQTLQSRLFADLATLIGSHGGYVFSGRFDNIIAVTNGMDLEDHRAMQESVSNRFPVTVSLSVAVKDSPVEALGAASQHLQKAGSAQDTSRKEFCHGEVIHSDERGLEDVHIAHFDVDNATAKYTDQLNEFDTYLQIHQAYIELMQYMRKRHDSLSFFVGGDNIIAVCPNVSEAVYRNVIDHVREATSIKLKVGVGAGVTASDAGIEAKHSLEECRSIGADIVISDPRVH
jgi:GTP cyclohydrolase IIa